MTRKTTGDILVDLCGAITGTVPAVDATFLPDPDAGNLFVAAVHAERRNNLGLDLLPRFANVACGTEATGGGDVRCPFFPPEGGPVRTVLWVHDERDGWEEVGSGGEVEGDGARGRATDLLRRASWIARALADGHLDRASFSAGPPTGPGVALPGPEVEAALAEALVSPDLPLHVPDALYWLWWATLVGSPDQLTAVRDAVADSPVRLVRDALALVGQLSAGDVAEGIDLRAVRERIRDEVSVFRAGPDARRRRAAEELRRSVNERLAFEGRGRRIRLAPLEPEQVPVAREEVAVVDDGTRVALRRDTLWRSEGPSPSPMAPVVLPGADVPEAMALSSDGRRALVAMPGDAVHEGDLSVGTWHALHPNTGGHRIRQLAYVDADHVAMVHTSSALYSEQLGQTLYVRVGNGLRATAGEGVRLDDPFGRSLATQQLLPVGGGLVVRWSPGEPGVAYFPFNGHVHVSRLVGGRLRNVASFAFDCASVERVGGQVVARATDGSAYRVEGLDSAATAPPIPGPDLGAEQRIPRIGDRASLPPAPDVRWRTVALSGGYRIEEVGGSARRSFEPPFDAAALGVPHPSPDDLRLCPSADGKALIVLHRRDTAIHEIRLSDGRWRERFGWEADHGWAVDVAELGADLVVLSSQRLALVRSGPRKRTLLWEYPLHGATAMALLPQRRLAVVLALAESPMRPALVPLFVREIERPAKTDNGGGPWATWLIDGECLEPVVRGGRLFVCDADGAWEVDPGALDRPPDWMVARKWVTGG